MDVKFQKIFSEWDIHPLAPYLRDLNWVVTGGLRVYSLEGDNPFTETIRRISDHLGEENLLPAKLVRYQVKDKAPWHHDVYDYEALPFLRTFVLQMTPSVDYDGGDLVLRTKDGEQTASREIGSSTLIPPDVEHCVTEVTRGERISLLCFSLKEPEDL